MSGRDQTTSCDDGVVLHDRILEAYCRFDVPVFTVVDLVTAARQRTKPD